MNKSLYHYHYIPGNLKVIQIDTASSDVILCVNKQISLCWADRFPDFDDVVFWLLGLDMLRPSNYLKVD